MAANLGAEDYSRAIHEYQARKDRLEKDLQAQQHQAEVLRKDNAALGAAVQALEESMEHAQRTIPELEFTLRLRERQIDQQMVTVEHLHQAVPLLRAEVAALRERLANETRHVQDGLQRRQDQLQSWN